MDVMYVAYVNYMDMKPRSVAKICGQQQYLDGIKKMKYSY